MINNQLILLLSLILFLCFGCQESPKDPILTGWPEITSQNKPWTRWWWMGNAVDKENITSQLEAFAKAGIGGVEISPIYGVKGYEDQFIDHLSAEWVAMLEHTIEEANRLGMQVDMIQGTGWPFGGPQIEAEMAASKLIVETYTLQEGEMLRETIQPSNETQRSTATLETMVAFNEQGEMIDITSEVNKEGKLEWTAEEGEWKLYALFCGKNRMKVKRPAPGGAGWVMDHFSSTALDAYIQPYETALENLNGELRTIFNDSYEVGGADWTPGFNFAFYQKRGYPIEPFLPYLLSQEHNDTVARIKSDYRETISDLVAESFLESWTDWVHEQGWETRNQAHGSPGNLLDLYAISDFPECESFNSTPFDIPGLRRDSSDINFEDPDPVMLKFASSAAHVMGKPITSAESLTWLGDHFRVALSQCKPEIEQLFLSGVNHAFFHGSTYSPTEEDWPGWKFYASVNFAPQNTIWQDAPAFFEYIARCQSILQTGRPDNEILVYWPVYDIWDDTESHSLLQQLKIHDISEWLQPTPFYRTVRQLMEAGYSVDFISDQQLAKAKVDEKNIRLPGGNYQTLVFPPCERMPHTTFEQALKLAKAGANILFTDLPEDVPGLHKLEERRKALSSLKSPLEDKAQSDAPSAIPWGAGNIFQTKKLTKTLEDIGIQGERAAEFNLKFIRRNLPDGKYYYLVNHSGKAVNDFVPIASKTASAMLLDPQNGEKGLAQLEQEDGVTKVRLQLKPGEAIIVRTFSQKLPSPTEVWPYIESEGTPLVLAGPWQVEFLNGGPEIPTLHTTQTLDSWTTWSKEAENFSGTARYQISFDQAEMAAEDYLLDLGTIRESARIIVNGQEAGTCWSIPFQLRIGKYLKEGNNTLEIEVTNLGANRIRYLDQQGFEWKKFQDINIVHVSYQRFDASGWEPMPSGLLGPVRLVPIKTIN